MRMSEERDRTLYRLCGNARLEYACSEWPHMMTIKGGYMTSGYMPTTYGGRPTDNPVTFSKQLMEVFSACNLLGQDHTSSPCWVYALMPVGCLVPLYFGKSKELRERLSTHWRNRLLPNDRGWYVYAELYETPRGAAAVELRYIKYAARLLGGQCLVNRQGVPKVMTDAHD